MKSLLVCLCFPLLLSSVVFGQEPNKPSNTAFVDNTASEKSTISPEVKTHLQFDQLRKDGFSALYNLDYQLAKKQFTQMTELEPDHPAGYLYLANCLWLDKLNKSKRLQTGLYNNDSFYSETKEQVDVKFDKEFKGLMEKAIVKAEAKIKSNPKDTDSLYYLGAAHGALGGYEATVVRAFMSALKNGSKSVDLHRKVLEQDPKFVDANLTIGMYNYVVGSLPLPVKILAAIGGFTGSKKRGLELLRQVTQNGRYAQDDARVMLIALYKREKRFSDALSELQTLAQKYPSNYLLKIEMADSLVRLNKYEESYQVFSSLLEDKNAASAKDIIEFQYAEALFSQDNLNQALEHYSAVVASKISNSDLITLSCLKMGQIYDLKNQREEAMSQYKAVLARTNVFDSQEQARKYLKTPYVKAKNNLAEPN